MNFHIITIFPEIFDSYFKESIIGRAIKNKLISIKFYNPRDFIKAPKNNYRPVDDKPYGGGPGMVMRAEPIIRAIEKVFKIVKKPHPRPLSISKKNGEGWMRSRRGEGIKIILFSPSGKKFETNYAKKLVKQKYTDIILISGRYEGIDARVKKIFKPEEISIGDYVLTGGELPAMILVDCISRQIPGVLGKYESLEEERVSTSEVYTRPEILKYKNKNYRVPKVLLSGNHQKIEEWKRGQ